MSDPSGRSFTGDFKRFFVRGLVVVLPSVLTLWIVVKAYQFIDNTIAEPINRGVRVMLVNTARVWEPMQDIFNPTETEIQKEEAAIEASGAAPSDRAVIRARLRRDNIVQWWANHWYMDLIGLFVAIIAVYIAGRLLGGFFGKRIYRKVEDIITTLPIFKQVYPYVKQVVDFLFSDERPIKFNRVVAVEYPRKGIWSVGFLTGATLRSIRARTGDSVTVFIPSSPTPFTGYTITVLRNELIELPLTVEEAIRFAVSGGVLVPGHEQDEEAGGPSASPAPAELPSGLIPLPRDSASGEEATGPPPPPDDPRDGPRAD
ncbi:MAG: DUF502 domain-containing protein [Planctomycetota bacterium]|nr:DUF502 domain-containing protein [Planctomycetota bacterium]